MPLSKGGVDDLPARNLGVSRSNWGFPYDQVPIFRCVLACQHRPVSPASCGSLYLCRGRPNTLSLSSQDRQTTSWALGLKLGLKLMRRSPAGARPDSLHPEPLLLYVSHHSTVQDLFGLHSGQLLLFRDILLSLYSSFSVQWQKIRSH
jgi:hypothetical protein